MCNVYFLTHNALISLTKIWIAPDENSVWYSWYGYSPATVSYVRAIVDPLLNCSLEITAYHCGAANHSLA